MGILGLFALGACNNKNTQGHEGHGHSTVTHNNDEHDHEAEGHDHEAEGHTHGTEGECNGDHKHDAADNHQGTAAGHDETAEAAHSDEIILPKAKADAAGVKVSIVEPAPFQQVIKTSGQVLAAQGDESVAVATVAGVVSFRGKVTEGMSVGSGTPLVTISSHNIADGDPVQRARIAYEVSKKEYERMKALVKNKIVSDKDFAQAEQNYENARISYEALAKNRNMNILLCRVNAHGIGMTQHTAILFRGTVYNCYNDIRAVCLFLMLRKISFSSYILFSLFVPDSQENLDRKSVV